MAKRQKSAAAACSRLATHVTAIAVKEAKRRGEKTPKAEIAATKSSMRKACKGSTAKSRACWVRAKSWKALQTCARKAGATLGRRKRR